MPHKMTERVADCGSLNGLHRRLVSRWTGEVSDIRLVERLVLEQRTAAALANWEARPAELDGAFAANEPERTSMAVAGWAFIV